MFKVQEIYRICNLISSCACILSFFSCVGLCDPMDCSLPGSSVQWDSPGKNIGVGCHAFLQGIFLAQGSNPCLLRLLHWQTALYQCTCKNAYGLKREREREMGEPIDIIVMNVLDTISSQQS